MVKFNFLLVLIMLLSFFSPNDILAQSNQLESIAKTIKEASLKAEKGYQTRRVEPLLDAVKILLDNSKGKKIIYQSKVTAKREYNNLLDIAELLKNADAFCGRDDKRMIKRIKQLKKRYSEASYVTANGDENIEVIECEITAEEEEEHQIDCEKNTDILIETAGEKLLRIYIDGNFEDKTDNFFRTVNKGTCILKLENNNSESVTYLIYKED